MKSRYRNAAYSYIFASSETHEDINNLEDFKRVGDYSNGLGLFYRGICVGKGTLVFENRKKKYLHTEYTRIHAKYRNRGHGVHLYLALIDAARRLGAKRLYASQGLNKLSRRMWSEKLDKVGVEVMITRGCRKACKHCDRKPRYYVEL